MKKKGKSVKGMKCKITSDYTHLAQVPPHRKIIDEHFEEIVTLNGILERFQLQFMPKMVSQSKNEKF